MGTRHTVGRKEKGKRKSIENGKIQTGNAKLNKKTLLKK
jgi:hypothetical protein